MLVGQRLTSYCVHLFFIFRPISFVGNEYFLDVGDRMLVNLFEPILNVIKSDLFSTIVHQEDTHGSFVVCLCNRSKSLLSRSVPNLQLYRLIGNIYSFYPEVYPDGRHVGCWELVVRKSQEQTSFAHTTITDDDQLKKIIVLRFFHRHF